MTTFKSTPKILKVVKEIENDIYAITQDLVNSKVFDYFDIIKKSINTVVSNSCIVFYENLIKQKLAKYECDSINISNNLNIEMFFESFELIIYSDTDGYTIAWKLTNNGVDKLNSLQ